MHNIMPTAASHKRVVRVLTIIFLTSAGVSQADDSLDWCRAIDDDARRLACFDEVLANPPAQAPGLKGEIPEAGVPADPPPIEPSPKTPTPAPSTPKPSPAASQSSPPKAAEASVDQLLVDAFGAEQLPAEKRPSVMPSGELKMLEATVVKVRRSEGGSVTVTLANGQVWQQTDFFYFPVEDGDGLSVPVEIKRRIFSGYKLSPTDSRRTIAVERIR